MKKQNSLINQKLEEIADEDPRVSNALRDIFSFERRSRQTSSSRYTQEYLEILDEAQRGQ